jgi:hypothetical protein
MATKNKVTQDGKNVEVLGSEESMFHATGTRDKDFATVLLNQAADCIWEPMEKIGGLNKVSAVVGAMEGISPRDAIEGMLTAQMVGIHNASMECLKRAMLPSQTFEGRQANLNQSTKLTRTYTAQMEALNRHRGKGQQKMTVEHVHVHNGGQAIVGSVTQGGVDENKERQPHAKQITHAPGEALPCQDQAEDVVPIASNAKRKM